MALDLTEYRQTLDSYVADLPERVQEVALGKAGAFLVRIMKDRIFNQGLDKFFKIFAEGYSSKPMYVSKEQFARPSRFVPQGKNDLAGTRAGKKGANGQRRKTMYLPFGYKELKAIQGLQSDRINLLYRGDLKASFIYEVEGAVLYIGFNSLIQGDKARHLATKFGTDIFHAADEELLEYYDRLVAEMRKIYAVHFKA